MLSRTQANPFHTAGDMAANWGNYLPRLSSVVGTVWAWRLAANTANRESDVIHLGRKPSERAFMIFRQSVFGKYPQIARLILKHRRQLVKFRIHLKAPSRILEALPRSLRRLLES